MLQTRSNTSTDIPKSTHLPIHPHNLLLTPILPHILRPKRLNLLIKTISHQCQQKHFTTLTSPRKYSLRPQNPPKPIHNLLQLPKPQLRLSIQTPPQIILHLLQPNMNLMMLTYQVIMRSENRHPLREFREDVGLFYGMVRGELATELQAVGEVLADGEAGGFAA